MAWYDIVTAGTGLLGSLLQNAANRSENQKNRDFNSTEAEKQRQFQKDEWSRQFDLQRDEWYNQLYAQQNAQYQQFLREAEYNSPANQAKRLSEAGLNPSALLGGQGSSGLVSAATGNVHSAPAPSVPSGGPVSGASASAPSPIPMQNPLGGLESVGSFLRDVAQATKDKTLLEPMVRMMTSQIYGQDLQNSLLETEIFIKQANLPSTIGKAYAEFQNELMDVTLKQSIDENYKADTLVKKAESFLKEAQKKCSDEELKILQFQVNYQLETWQADMAVKRSERQKNVASANQSNSQALYNKAITKTEDEIRQFKVDNEHAISEISGWNVHVARNEAKISDLVQDKKYQATLTEFVEKAKQAGLLTDQMQNQLDIAVKEKNWWLVNHLILPIVDRCIEAAKVPAEYVKASAAAGGSAKK